MHQFSNSTFLVCKNIMPIKLTLIVIWIWYRNIVTRHKCIFMVLDGCSSIHKTALTFVFFNLNYEFIELPENYLRYVVMYIATEILRYMAAIGMSNITRHQPIALKSPLPLLVPWLARILPVEQYHTVETMFSQPPSSPPNAGACAVCIRCALSPKRGYISFILGTRWAI